MIVTFWCKSFNIPPNRRFILMHPFEYVMVSIVTTCQTDTLHKRVRDNLPHFYTVKRTAPEQAEFLHTHTPYFGRPVLSASLWSQVRLWWNPGGCWLAGRTSMCQSQLGARGRGQEEPEGRKRVIPLAHHSLMVSLNKTLWGISCFSCAVQLKTL